MGNTALQFDGSQNYASLGVVSSFVLASPSSPFTIEAVINTVEAKSSCIFSIGFSFGSNLGLEMKTALNAGNIFLELFYGNTSADSSTIAGQIPVGSNVHLAITYDGANLIMHIAGAQIFNSAKTMVAVSGVNSSYIGSEGGASNFFHGTIDEIRYSNIARYTSANFTPPAQPFSPDANTIALYHFDEGHGLTTFDNTGNGNNATLQGSPLPVWVTGLVSTSTPGNGYRYGKVGDGMGRSESWT